MNSLAPLFFSAANPKILPVGLPKYFASEQHYTMKQTPNPDNEPSWLEQQQQPLPVAPEIQCDNTQSRDRIKSNLELLRQFRLEKFTADRDSLSRKPANYYPDLDEKVYPFDLLKRDGIEEGLDREGGDTGG